MKKLMSTVLATAMLSSSVTALAVNYGEEYQKLPTPQTKQLFSDVPSTHWAFDYIGEMAQREVLSGYPDGRFIPENQVTRAEFAKIMVGAAGLRVSNDGKTSFSDVYTSDWYCPYVECAKDYLTGYETSSGTIYKPTTPALREDIAVALVKLKGYDISLADESMLNMFTDNYSISSSARKYVAVAVERGIVSGYDDNTFRGQATITRAEAATLLWRSFQYGNDNKVVEPAETIVETPTFAPNPTEKPVETVQPTQEPEGKPYKIETMKSVDLERDFAYDNDNIYYIDGTSIYQMNMHTGEASNIYDTTTLKFQEETDSDVVREYSTYKPTQIIYDQYNDRLIMNGYYQTKEEAFKELETNAEYLVAYDITNDKLYKEFGDDFKFKSPICFIDKDKMILKYSGVSCLYNMESMSKLNDIMSDEAGNYGRSGNYYWTINNDLYCKNGYTIYHCSFSGDRSRLFEGSREIGINGEYVYYIPEDSDFSKVNKLNLSTGKINELDISSSDEKCEIKDMTPIKNIWSIFIPLSDDCIIFYDSNAKAFRKLSKN